MTSDIEIIERFIINSAPNDNPQSKHKPKQQALEAVQRIKAGVPITLIVRSNGMPPVSFEIGEPK